ncbi:protein-glutamate O-methyltransferase CheR [Halomonas sp. NyZ770]|uniref:CheR family methyltransferase n=1 Tax=Halomonas sp. NyZ770 TaxID=2883106 RepID=UPI001D0BBAAE|nr:protein-glutamate O-methyltransferase CheR [Halomonas sp. NyZ770]UDM06863.1 protein-glutamate O-methyltransferase CheR [Halomonas sp. NyZ770]
MTILTPFKQLVHQRCGLSLEGMAEARLERAIEQLCQAQATQDHATLLDKLAKDAALFDQFISQLTVNETYFFREVEALQWLADEHLPRQLAKQGGPLRLLSAGCSSGEEPYSLAMLLMETYGERAKSLFRITGGDVDQQVLHKARAGIYSGMAFRALHPALKARYFTPVGRAHQLVPALTEWVRFCPFNLLATDHPALGGPFDVILFRNVSIYFDEATRRDIQQRLKPLLAPQGILLCGVTETLGNDLGVLSLQEEQGVFYFQHAAPEPSRPPLPPPAATVTAPTMLETAPCEAAEVRPLPEAPPEPSAPPPPIPREKVLKQAHELLDNNHFDAALQLISPLLEQDPWCVDALLLAGLAVRWLQQPQQAYEFFKRAVYVAPECWPAHFYQAELLRQGELPDNPVQRQRGYAAVVRLLETTPQASGALQAIQPPLPPGDACFLAKRYLDEPIAIQGVG